MVILPGCMRLSSRMAGEQSCTACRFSATRDPQSPSSCHGIACIGIDDYRGREIARGFLGAVSDDRLLEPAPIRVPRAYTSHTMDAARGALCCMRASDDRIAADAIGASRFDCRAFASLASLACYPLAGGWVDGSAFGSRLSASRRNSCAARAARSLAGCVNRLDTSSSSVAVS